MADNAELIKRARRHGVHDAVTNDLLDELADALDVMEEATGGLAWIEESLTSSHWNESSFRNGFNVAWNARKPTPLAELGFAQAETAMLRDVIQAAYNAFHMETRQAAVNILHSALQSRLGLAEN